MKARLNGAGHLLIVMLLLTGCAPAIRPTVAPDEARARMAEFWVEPGGARDLYHGAWGSKHAPDPDAVYTLIKREPGGFSPKLDVKDPSGRKWAVKMGAEAASEVTSSRIVWGLGYHQPPSYYLRTWRIRDEAGVHPMGPGRFRLDLPELDAKGSWSWRQNPFVGTRPYGGLLVLMMMLNSTDLKGENNTRYELDRPVDGARRWYVVKDLGATLGQTGRFGPKRNNVTEFEKQEFLSGIEGGYLRFVFHGRHQGILRHQTLDDLEWMSKAVLRLSARQWSDAFRAGGYDADTTARYVRKIQAKAREGLAFVQAHR